MVHGMSVTEKGNINAEIVINAGGLWAREVGQLAGLESYLFSLWNIII